MSGPYSYYKTENQRKSNKVYINPNYNKNASHNYNMSYCNNVSENYNVNYSKNITENYSANFSKNMYLNPNFSHVGNTARVHCNSYSDMTRPKIYVNPNFIHPPSMYEQPSYSTMNTTPVVQSQPKPAVAQNQVIPPPLPPPPHVTKTRYTYIRQKENQVSNNSVPTKELPAKAPPSNTVRVNKYKLISLNTVKKKLAIPQHTDIPSVQRETHPIPHPNLRINKCKIPGSHITGYKVKRNSTHLDQSRFKYQFTRKPLNKSSISIRPRKISQSVLKKNNIPCPLFKKYGICLRKVRGTCEFLHDKKHVSICRKFLKGICHDNNCLLSHDMTDKKMPTCSFYLKGACTNEHCPYLHVKLNDKTKVCQEFMKGYCEKGDQCLYRHVNVGSALRNKSATPNKTSHRLLKKQLSLKVKIKRKSPSNSENRDSKESKSVDGEHRYFKETVDDNYEHCTLKPTRCKLGNLPSFIRL